ncbi:amidohydrolase [Frondihabitans sucicola]|uniref:6-methylsalicylate decarboxylase n=1 Tax=Frondihabitans sucicola TaxID=1268041 RepID=A0ABN6XUF4_9MICO|nr:amidohydrolase family protein [Frondihabitans sucicola]BDZ48534.1 amidohydrolase [Frondihabitans sucicola]
MATETRDLIDVHAHFVTDDYAAAAKAGGHDSPDGMPVWPTWSLPEQLGAMDRRRIRKAILSISSPGVHFGDDDRAGELARYVNDEAASIVGRQPERLSFFASLTAPDIDGAVREVRRAMGELGAVGVVLESNAHGQYLGDPALEPLWAELDRRHAIVFVHPTSPVGWERTALGRPRPMLEFLFDTTRSIVDLVFAGVLTRYPDLRVIVPHSGATLPFLSDRIALFQRLSGDAGDAMPWAGAMRRLWFDTAGTPFPTDIPVLEGIAGAERIVYGSDSCWTPATGVDAQIASIDAAPAPAGASSWRELTSRNAEALLGL